MSASGKKPIRTCVGCRTAGQKTTLTRVVRKPGGDVVVDRTGKLPGRGAYLCGAKECLASAIKHNKLGRALRCEIPGPVVTELESLAVKNDDGE
jgi:predicted RNA-binding protein YlxR (DUF448 family)